MALSGSVTKTRIKAQTIVSVHDNDFFDDDNDEDDDDDEGGE